MVEIRLVKHSQEKEQLMQLFRASFGHDMPAELWDWKYIQNPLAPPDPEVIVALDNGRIVGARPFRLAEMWLGDEKVRVAQGTDVMVHPEHRRKGILKRMSQFGIEYLKENGYAVYYGCTNPKLLTEFLKQGYRIVAPMETIFHVLNPQKLIAHKLGNRVIGGGLGFLYDMFLNISRTETLLPSTPFHVAVFSQFNDELKEIDTLRDESLIELVRSESYLRWRFDRRPRHNYKYIVAKRDNRLSGYTVVSAEKQGNGLVYGYIVDHLTKDRDTACFRALIGGSLNYLEQSGCDVVFIRALGEPALRKQLLNNLGFKSSLLFPYNRLFRYSYLHVVRIDEQVAPEVNIYDKENWQVNYTYSDVR
jgi:GNAT superfamily N-acetyltransferase